MKSVTITTDGACIPNPGKGAWAYSVEGDLGSWHATGSEDETTNNRMEMEAVIRGLEAIKEPARITLRTDSMYVVYAVRRYEGGGRTKTNKDLVIRLWDAMRPHKISVQWIRGHAGDRRNEFVDSLANGLCVA